MKKRLWVLESLIRVMIEESREDLRRNNRQKVIVMINKLMPMQIKSGKRREESVRNKKPQMLNVSV